MPEILQRLNEPKARRRLIVTVTLLFACAAMVLSMATRLTPYARDRIIDALGDRFEAEIELATFQLSVFPRPAISGEGLAIRHRGRRDVPPLISIQSFSAGAGLLGLVSRPLRLHSVELHGLELRLPKGREPRNEEPGADRRGEDAGIAPGRKLPPAPRAPANGASDPRPAPLVIGRITSTDARVEIASSKPGKPPRVFQIHHLVLDEFGLDRPARFDASLTNPKPEGLIETTGTFGPWQRDDPRATPVEGTYTFTNVDLDTIKGIGGRLSSKGRFDGVLERLVVEGTTDTPDFSIDIAGRPVKLETRFKAVVDGTSGDTWLTPVDATLISSRIRAEGAVVRAEDVKGRHIALDVSIGQGRIEDLLALTIKSGKSPLLGAITLTTRLEIPAGERDVVEKLRLQGQFLLREARFTNFNVQKRIDELSRRGRGQEGADGGSVVSNMKGQFELRDGRLTFPDLTFGVPGAVVQLSGRYSLLNEALAFRGDLLLEAELSETTSGWKAVLGRLAQPLFRRPGGGSRIPIKIEGTREKPEFGLDLGRVMTPGK